MSASVSFLVSELGKWDALDSAPETLVLPFFADERPLRGAAGLCDWRLCGRLSRLLQGSRIAGKFGEFTLFPPNSGGRRRLPFSRLLLVGLGAADRFDEAAALQASRLIAEKMAKLGTPRYALVLPGRSTGRFGARRALEMYLKEAKSGEIVVIESVPGQKEAAELARAR
jgi:hypothetical protein